MKQKNWPKCVEYASKAMTSDPQNETELKWKALYRRGVALKHLKRYPQAAAELTMALKLKPDYAKAKKHLESIRKLTKPPAPPLTTIKGLKEKKVGINEFEIQGDLGEGNFSNVIKVIHKITKEYFALKTIEIKKVKRLRIRHPNIDNEIMMEKTVLSKLNHPGIIKMYHTFKDASNLYFLLEYCPGGEVWSKLKMGDEMVGLRDSLARFYASQIVSSLTYLQSQGIVHRDLKPENMMLTQSGHVKLVDFGTAKDLNDTKFNGPEFVGTPEYMSPELLKSKESSCDSDLWALGCVIYQLHTGYPPFKALSPFLAMQRAIHLQLVFPGGFPKDAQDLVSRLLVWNPKSRISLKEMRDHAYFHGVDWDHVHDAPVPKPTEREARLDKIVREPWKVKDFRKELNDFDRAYVMNVLQRKKQLLSLHRRFFPGGAAAANCCRARNHRYLGLTRRDEEEYKDSVKFLVVAAPKIGDSSGEGKNRLVEMVKRANEIQPRPRAVVLLGPLTKSSPCEKDYESQVEMLQDILSELEPEILPMFAGSKHDIAQDKGVSYRRHFGDTYFSTWFGGVKLLVMSENHNLDSTRPIDASESLNDGEDEEIGRWLKYELYIGNLCATNMVVVANSDVSVPSKCGNQLEVLRMMKSKKVRSMIVGGPMGSIDTITKLSELSIEDGDEEEEKEEEKKKKKKVDAPSHLGPCLPEEEEEANQSEDEDEADRKASEGVEMDIVRVFDRDGDKMTTFVATATRRRVRYKNFE